MGKVPSKIQYMLAILFYKGDEEKYNKLIKFTQKQMFWPDRKVGVLTSKFYRVKSNGNYRKLLLRLKKECDKN